ncbi:hypothetical protein NP493_91g04000 [Ridgeia piscesae]|uniref:C-type lectin domain-containing protein n=1 Tax=Ridgeia piscesae TaxID=27915 RepID=A0AAD9UHZ6_RIDPI|nr:hypothetical protein NP493_91g04000 [Ridgeia piscesae]
MTMGAILLRIEDSFEKAWVDKQLKSMQSTARHHVLEEPEYWLGATDLMNEGMWMWINETSPMTNVKNSWLPNGNDNFQGSENCLAMKRHVPCRGSKCRAPVYGWVDAACYQRKFYVCESNPIS